MSLLGSGYGCGIRSVVMDGGMLFAGGNISGFDGFVLVAPVLDVYGCPTIGS